MKYAMPDGRIAAKVQAGATGGGIGSLVAVVVLFILTRTLGDVPADVQVAIAGIVSYAIAYLSTVVTAYATPPAKEDVPVPAPPKNS